MGKGKLKLSWMMELLREFLSIIMLKAREKAREQNQFVPVCEPFKPLLFVPCQNWRQEESRSYMALNHLNQAVEWCGAESRDLIGSYCHLPTSQLFWVMNRKHEPFKPLLSTLHRPLWTTSKLAFQTKNRPLFVMNISLWTCLCLSLICIIHSNFPGGTGQCVQLGAWLGKPSYLSKQRNAMLGEDQQKQWPSPEALSPGSCPTWGCAG